MGQLLFRRLDAQLPAGRQTFFRAGNENDHDLVIHLWNHFRIFSGLLQRLADTEKGPSVFPPVYRHVLLYDDGAIDIPVGGKQQPPDGKPLSRIRPFFSTLYRDQ